VGVKDSANAIYQVESESAHVREDEVPRGYKRTEVGVIPEDWEVVQFRNIVGQYVDYRGRTPTKLGMSWGGGDILALSANNVQMGRIAPELEANYGSEELYRRWMKQGACEHRDVLLTMEAPLGNVAQVPDTRKYILSQRVLLIKPNKLVTRDFLADYLQGDVFQVLLTQSSTGSTALGIQRRVLDQLPVCFPERLAEQEAIAEALGDADALIESLQQLIAKKRAIKQGAMQALLTGRQRLSDFSGRWSRDELKRLVASPITDGPHLTPTFYESGVPFLSVNNLVNNKIDLSDLRYISKQDDEIFARKCKPRLGDVLIGKAASVGKVAIVENNLNFNIWSPIALIRSSKHIFPKFLYYQLLSADCISQIMLRTNASSQGNIGMADIETIQIAYPPFEEQTAIAAVLSDMDAEIEALEARLAKIRALKAGIMQALLTGRIRLPLDRAA